MKIIRKFTLFLFFLFFIVFSHDIYAAKISPFSGLLLQNDEQLRPVMAIIDNNESANPQAGLDKASIVYEFPVEGGITRFLALFYDKLPHRIGPVRSARTYLIEKAYEYSAVLMHSGASPQGYELLAFRNMFTFDEFYHSFLYWREDEREAPHNLFTGWPYLQNHLAEVPYKNFAPRFPFLAMNVFADSMDGRGCEIEINFSGNNKVLYRYQIWDGYYKRYVNDQIHVTDANEPLNIDNLVIQFVESSVVDKEGRLDIPLVGSGQAIVFRDGIAIEGTWLKVGPGWTSYLDSRGRLIGFNPGATWIEIVPLNRKVKYR